ncbi:hypothetical protein [Marinobacterium sp. BA1]|uniref:hypothetical protein n=1 Tax=Marinobacterium sp. BA1 TaxID=3138931 RepID=UPI0032E5FFFC
MRDDKHRQEALTIAAVAAEIAYDQGLSNGIQQGFVAGQAVGFILGVSSLKAALSSGLRHGSPECGRALESLKRLCKEK